MMTLLSIFIAIMQYTWFGVGMFISIIIIGAVVTFFYKVIKDFTMYTYRKLFKKGRK